MCTILLAWRHAAAPVIVAANRDELVARASAPPQALSDVPPITGGRDLVAGGTWLAVRRDDGRIAAVTNRRPSGSDEIARDPARRSRGLLPVAVLQTAGDADAEALIRRIPPEDYNPFNLLYIGAERALVLHSDGEGPADVRLVEPGLHVLCVHDLDAESAKEAGLRARLRDAIAPGAGDGPALEAMTEMLRDHRPAAGDAHGAACLHGDVYGTVSASTVVIAKDGEIDYRHAPGRPCVTAFEAVA